MKLITDHPIAVDSPDHLCPVGAVNDNYTNHGLIDEILNYFNYNKINVADFGCAGGQFVIDFLERGVYSIGLEGSSNVLFGQGRHNWANYLNKNLFLCDLTKDFTILNNNNQIVKFDLIHSSEVLEHINEKDLNIFLKNVKLHLAENGICCFQIGLGPDIRYKDGVEFILHQSVFTPEKWIKIFKDNGLYVVPTGNFNQNQRGFLFKNKFRDHGETLSSLYICLQLQNSLT